MKRNQILKILNKKYFSEDHNEKLILNQLPEILHSTKFFVDIGASLGQYTYHANKHIKRGYIYAIEADPLRFDELKKNCILWESFSDNKIQAIHAAISDKDGRTVISGNSTGSDENGVYTINISANETAALSTGPSILKVFAVSDDAYRPDIQTSTLISVNPLSGTSRQS